MSALNSLVKIGVKGAIESGVKTVTKTKIAWLIITVVFHALLQFWHIVIRLIKHFAAFQYNVREDHPSCRSALESSVHGPHSLHETVGTLFQAQR
jgi:hypothetical protein